MIARSKLQEQYSYVIFIHRPHVIAASAEAVCKEQAHKAVLICSGRGHVSVQV